MDPCTVDARRAFVANPRQLLGLTRTEVLDRNGPPIGRARSDVWQWLVPGEAGDPKFLLRAWFEGDHVVFSDMIPLDSRSSRLVAATC